MIHYPLKLTAVPKDMIWGGRKLNKIYGKFPSQQRVAESWELTVRCDGMSVIENGAFSGTSLEEYIDAHPDALGSDVAGEDFPLLIKFIDAALDLSLQVHPDDEYARIHESEHGKTEMWYVIDADEGAEIIYGLCDSVTKEKLKRALEDSCILDKLNRMYVRKGDVFFVPPGQIHAICRGVLLAEIQQNSNVTYRIYDYDRIDSDGKKRELHVDKALNTVRYYTKDDLNTLQFCGKAGRRQAHEGFNIICDCSHFRVSTACLSEDRSELRFTVDEKSFVSLLFTDAENASVCCGGVTVTASSGDSIFIPAGAGAVVLRGKCNVLLSEC